MLSICDVDLKLGPTMLDFGNLFELPVNIFGFQFFFFNFRLPKLKVDQLCLNGVLPFVIPKVTDQWPNLSPWNISVNPIFVTKFACQIKEKMANTGRFYQESTILKILYFPAKTMCTYFSFEQKIWQQKGSGLGFSILFSKNFWTSVRKKCSCDREKEIEIWCWRPRICKMF